MNNFKSWKIINEYANASRYSIEVNFKSNSEEVLEAFAKISLGYVSSAVKKLGLHTKHVYTESPIRLMVSLNKWEDGEHIIIVSWDSKNKCFVLSNGLYNKPKKTVSIKKVSKCSGKDASEIYKEIYKKIEELKK